MGEDRHRESIAFIAADRCRLDAYALRRAKVLLNQVGIVRFHSRCRLSLSALFKPLSNRSWIKYNKIIHPLTVIDKLIKKNELGQPFALMDHQREVLRLAFDFDKDGRLPWDTIIYSCIKKSGKTTLNGAITLAWGFTQEAPNEILDTRQRS